MSYLLVDVIPEQLEEGIVYVSERYSTASHLCACGCRTEVVTRLGRGAWRASMAASGISMYPSIGNGSFPCKSHYYIVRGRIRWESAYSADMIARARRADNPRAHLEEEARLVPAPGFSVWTRIVSWLRRLI